MTIISALLLVLLQAAQASPPAVAAPTPPQAQRPAPCATPLFRQFDFWVGSWDVVNAAGKFVGTNRIERIGDCFLQENWAAASGGYTGRSLNSVGFNRKWHQTWADTSGLRLELAGGLVDGNMVMEGDTPSSDPRQPTPTRNRITWRPEAGGSVRQLWQTSADEGKTWTTSFDGRYHPASSEAVLPEGFFRRAGGAWIGSGSVMRRDAHVELRIWRGVGSTVRLQWRNVMQGPSRDLFEASAVYEKKAEREYVATWWDSQGAKHPITATVSPDGSSLTALWGNAGKTVYALIGSGELEVIDSVKRPDGTWAEFGRTTLRRQ